MAFVVQPGSETADAGRAVKIVLQILAAVPQGLYRRAFAGLGDESGLSDDVHFQPTAETATQQGQVKLYFVVGDAQHLCHHMTR